MLFGFFVRNNDRKGMVMIKSPALNILWISYEDTSPRFPCYGDNTVETPNLDRLVRNGCVYDHCFSSAGDCAPSRASVITGCWPTWLGAHHMRTTHTDPTTPELPTPYECTPPHQVRCVSEYFQRAGYYCTNNAKTDYQFNPPTTARDDCSRDAHWRNRQTGQPFFAVWNFDQSHESCMWDEPPKWHGPLPDSVPRTDPLRVPIPPEVPDTPETRRSLAKHYDRIAHNDQRLGVLLDQLEEDGEAENTLVMIWSDHGTGLPRHKRWPYDGGIHIPLIVRWPQRIEPGSRSQRMVSQVDFAPTIMAAAGLNRPNHFHGAPFCGPHEISRQYIFASRDRYDTTYDKMRAVRNQRYKLIRNDYPEIPYLGWQSYRNQHPMMRELWRRMATDSLEPAQDWVAATQRPVFELYDCEEDPHELHNLANNSEMQTIKEELETALDEWCASYDVRGNVSEAEMVRSWWPDGTQPQTAAVLAIALGEESAGLAPLAENDQLQGRHLVQLHCSTQGSSIEYKLNDQPWSVYTGPFHLMHGDNSLQARACRIGYQQSTESHWDISVT